MVEYLVTGNGAFGVEFYLVCLWFLFYFIFSFFSRMDN